MALVQGSDASSLSANTQRLAAVVVCVDRAQPLALTLKHNAPLVDELLIVTTSNDLATQAVARTARCTLVISDRCYDDRHAFNKGRMINDGLRHLAEPGWIILTDADVFLCAGLRDFLCAFPLDPDILYGTTRFDVHPDEVASFQAGGFKLTGAPSMGANAEPNGYFQLFHRQSSAIHSRGPELMCEEFCSAGGVDSWFKEQWDPTCRIQLPQIAVAHLTHGATIGDHWNGGRPGGWRQWGMLRARGFLPIEKAPTQRPLRLRLTDTLRGECHEVLMDADDRLPPEAVVPNGAGGLKFFGKDIANQLIHVAYFVE